MEKCKRCYSYAVNHHCHGRDGSDPDLCDVCYWRTRAELAKDLAEGRDHLLFRASKLECERDKYKAALENIINSEDIQSVQSYGLGDIAREALHEDVKEKP